MRYFYRLMILILISAIFQISCLDTLHAAEKIWAVKTGYNFFSLEVTPSATVTSGDIMSEHGELQSIFRFNESTQEFEFQLRINENTIFGNSFNIVPGKGYIISSNGEVNISWTGEILEYNPYDGILTGFNLVGFTGLSSGGSAKTLLNSNSGLKSVFRWNYENQAFEYLLKFEDGNIFGNDFTLDSGTAYFVNFEGLKDFGTGRLCLNGNFLVSENDSTEPISVSGVLVKIGDLATVTDTSGNFFFDENGISLGNSNLTITYEGKDYSVNFDIQTPEQNVFMIQYFKSSDKFITSHTSVDYSESNSINFKTGIKLRDGSSVSDIFTSSETKISQQKNQPYIIGEMKTQIENSINSASADSKLSSLALVKDYTVFLGGIDLKLKTILKSIILVGEDQTLINKYSRNMEYTAVFSDGSSEDIASELVFSTSDNTVLDFSNKIISGLSEGTSIIKLTLRELDSNSLTITVIPNPVTGLSISNYSSNQVTVSFVTSSEFMTSVDYGTTVNFGSNVTEEQSSKIHTIQISSLNENTKYYYKINLDEINYININPAVENEVLEFTTALLPQSPSSPISMGGKVLDKNDGNLENAVVYVRTAETHPLMALSNSNGIFLVELSNLKNKTTGAQYTISTGTEIIIDVYHYDGKILNNKYILEGDSPHEAGIYKIQ